MNEKKKIFLIAAVGIVLVISLGAVAIKQTIKSEALEEFLIFTIEMNSFCADYNNMTTEELSRLFLEYKTQEIIQEDFPQ